MDPYEIMLKVENREDMANFVGCLRQDLENNPGEWENISLVTYLDAVEAIISSLHYAASNKNNPELMEPSWKNFAGILLGAKIYE
jgi:hypothetical protein